ncbi:MAG: hypothetical protein JW838_00090 [Spirochaetes bacterium]|nr:hypothetical protein [Spirochaetota bacterium]
MKLHKALRNYYRDQIDALNIGPGRFIMEKRNNGRVRSQILSLAFHAILMALILTAMLSGWQRPSHLEQQMGLIISRHSPGEWFTDRLERMIFVIKKYRNTGGAL